MKLNKLFLFGLIAAAGLTSCTSEDFPQGYTDANGEKGILKLGVAIAEPTGTRANSAYTDEQLATMPKANNYPIEIYDSKDELIRRYDAASLFPTSGLTLNVGNYTVESHTSGILEKKMDKAYYRGSETFPIKAGITSNVDVVCKMQNSMIQVRYTDEFLSWYRTWTITIDDGSETALVFTNTDGNTPAAVYWLFEEGIEQLTINFRATLASDGSPVSDTKVLSKDNFQRPYDDDNSSAFTGGDQLIFTFNPSAATTGEMGITISATITFTETEETETVYLTDKGLDDNGDDNGGDTPTPPTPPDNPKDDLVSIECAGGFEVTIGKNDSGSVLPQTEVVISTPKGLNSLTVRVTGGNEGFAGAIGAFGLDETTEIIDNEDLGFIFNGVGKDLPVVGDKQYKFPVYAFFSMIQEFPATEEGKAHEFYIVAEDKEGNKQDATLKITVTE